MQISYDDFLAIYLSVKLAIFTTLFLLIICIPLAWFIVISRSKFRIVVNAVCTTPLILPPSVIGYYLLTLFAPNGIIGHLTVWSGIGVLSFSFSGLVIASIIYSLPFVLQPIQAQFLQIGLRPIETAMMLGLSRKKAFLKAVLPQSKIGIISAAILGFAHTIGEFGVVLMIGGNIPGKTQVVSIQIYNHVEAFEYQNANQLAMFMLMFSFITLFLTYWLQNYKAKYV